MARRSESFDKFIAEKMQNKRYARTTLLTSIKEFDDSVEEALKYTIQKMGIKEFSNASGVSVQNISDFIRGTRNLKAETLDKYLAVFELKSKVVVVDAKDVA